MMQAITLCSQALREVFDKNEYVILYDHLKDDDKVWAESDRLINLLDSRRPGSFVLINTGYGVSCHVDHPECTVWDDFDWLVLMPSSIWESRKRAAQAANHAWYTVATNNILQCSAGCFRPHFAEK